MSHSFQNDNETNEDDILINLNIGFDEEMCHSFKSDSKSNENEILLDAHIGYDDEMSHSFHVIMKAMHVNQSKIFQAFIIYFHYYCQLLFQYFILLSLLIFTAFSYFDVFQQFCLESDILFFQILDSILFH